MEFLFGIGIEIGAAKSYGFSHYASEVRGKMHKIDGRNIIIY